MALIAGAGLPLRPLTTGLCKVPGPNHPGLACQRQLSCPQQVGKAQRRRHQTFVVLNQAPIPYSSAAEVSLHVDTEVLHFGPHRWPCSFRYSSSSSLQQVGGMKNGTLARYGFRQCQSHGQLQLPGVAQQVFNNRVAETLVYPYRVDSQHHR